MKDELRRYKRKSNWITGIAMLLTFLLVRLIFPEMDSRKVMLIALIAGFIASIVIYLVEKRKKEKEEEEKLPPV